MFNTIKKLFKRDTSFSLSGKDGVFILTQHGKEKEISKEEASKFLKGKTITSFSSSNANASPLKDLFDNWKKDSEKKIGVFNEHVTLKTNIFSSTMDTTEEGVFSGDVSFEFEVISVKNRENLGNYSGAYEGLTCANPLSEEVLNKILVCGLSGVYATPYEYDDMIQAFYYLLGKNRQKGNYYCEECKECYDDIHTFLKHLEVTKHKDTIVEQFPYFNFY